MESAKKPKKGILKTSSSFDAEHSQHKSKEKGMKWDEMNIIATHHPPDKDYGHMKIDEPPTPYSKYSDQEDDDETCEGRRASIGKSDNMDPSSLTSKLENLEGRKIARTVSVSTEDEDESSEDEELTEEQFEHKKRFEQKRKLHYNEFQAIKLAKQLMEEEDEDDDDDGSNKTAGKNDNDNTQSQDSLQMQTDENRNPEESTKSQSYGTTGVTAVTQESSSGQKETLIN